MRAVIQRVNRAAVRVDGEVVGEITRPGLMVLVGATHDDGPAQVATVARKIADLRLLEGELSVTDAGAPVLVVSQFTLYADTRKGRRPTWNKAAPGEVAEPLVEAVAEDLRGAVVVRGAHEDHEARAGDLADHLAVDPDRRVVDPLDDGAHQRPALLPRPSRPGRRWEARPGMRIEERTRTGASACRAGRTSTR